MKCSKYLLPPANEVCGKVMFLQVSVILFTGGGVPSPGGCLLEAPLPRRLLLRAVRILLECILVFSKFITNNILIDTNEPIPLF